MVPNATEEKSETEVHPYKSGAFEAWITWRALGGLIVEEEGQKTDRDTGKKITVTNQLRTMPLSEFCETFRVDRKTLWRWAKQTPDLAQRIAARRNEITPLARVSVAYNQLFLLGMQSQDKRAAVDALKTFLGNFGDLQLPVQRQDIKVQGGLMEVLAAAQRDGIIEGEVVEPTNSDTGSGQETPGPLPIPS